MILRLTLCVRVESGEYLDWRLGFPGADTERGGAFEVLPDGRRQRLYWRHSPEYATAHAAGLLEPLPRLTPASAEAIADFEADLGRPLPQLLRRCYAELGDGGFGPSYALLPLSEMLEDYRAQQQNWSEMPSEAAALLPICHWGCGISSFVDLSDPAHRMWAIDPDPNEDYQAPLFAEPFDLTEWIHRWARGTLMQPCLPYDEKTGPWPGDTDADAFGQDSHSDPWADSDPWHDIPHPDVPPTMSRLENFTRRTD
ncbi:SMI1/KNR4 family protein [Nocardia sp. NPDC059228]|uniref:SMI1/KNR4 family protein n=1 Tax=Nocardia sp. NPDC059228 TaxID=3346777 RepID=UPI0036874F52